MKRNPHWIRGSWLAAGILIAVGCASYAQARPAARMATIPGGRAFARGWRAARRKALDEAATWWHKAAAQGNASASFNLGLLPDLRDLIFWEARRNATTSIKSSAAGPILISKALDRGTVAKATTAMRTPGRRHRSDERAQRGDPRAEYRLALRFYLHATPADLTRAAAWGKRAARQGYAAGEYFLAGLYLDGLGLRRNRIAAYRWALLAQAAAGEREYLYEAGEHFQLGQRWPPPEKLMEASVTGLRLAAAPRIERAAKTLLATLGREMSAAEIARARQQAASRRQRQTRD